MGYFTFTDATVRSPRCRQGEYLKKDKIAYGGYIKVVCPDDTVYEDECYDGYGHVGIHDVYDLVVDWNKSELKKILTDRENSVLHGGLKDIVNKYIETGYDDQATTEYVKKLVEEGMCGSYLISEWKRNIGIMLACEDRDNASLRFPIKVTKTRDAVDYEDLYPSRSTQ